MSKNSNRSFRYTALALKFLEKILGSKFTVEGLENLPNQPILFVANHFTRSETFIIPYIIYKHTGKQIRCLADSGLFSGTLGRFLKSVGTLSTNDPRRNEIIISDLMTGDYNWMIYPEGSMVKNKEIKNSESFISSEGFTMNTPSRIGSTRTGSAVLALQSELYRKDYIDATRKNKKEVINFYRKNYLNGSERNLSEINTYIVPVNITYYPIRPGTNRIKKLTTRFFEKLPKQIAEEVEIEGNLLLSADMNISFGTAISVDDYIKSSRSAIYQIPIIKNETKINLIIKYLKHRLTTNFMGEIYCDTKINIDHLFAAILYNYPEDQIEIGHLKNLLFFSSIMISHTKKYRMNDHLSEDNLFKIFIDKKHNEFESVVKLAKSLSIITLSDDKKSFILNKEKLHDGHDFHDIRLENTLQVIANEFFLLEAANDVIRRNIALGLEKIKEKVFNYLVNYDLQIFEEDYKKYQEPGVSRDHNVGSPLFLNSNNKKYNNIGIVICHGYLSAPKEVEQLAYNLNKLGFRTYSVRLKGHGTAPINIKDVTWQEWQDSLLRGYSALKIICSQVIVVGFSTGALLSLVSSIKETSDALATISINPALKLRDIKAKIVPGINIWNDFLDKFHIEKGKMEYVRNSPENPHINYTKNYLKGVEQLELLMGECEDNLDKITTPSLLIYSKNDPVVDPQSSKIIWENLGSKVKELIEINSDKHVIVTGKVGEDVFRQIEYFLEKLGIIEIS